jgi:hypothetical protein
MTGHSSFGPKQPDELVGKLIPLGMLERGDHLLDRRDLSLARPLINISRVHTVMLAPQPHSRSSPSMRPRSVAHSERHRRLTSPAQLHREGRSARRRHRVHLQQQQPAGGGQRTQRRSLPQLASVNIIRELPRGGARSRPRRGILQHRQASAARGLLGRHRGHQPQTPIENQVSPDRERIRPLDHHSRVEVDGAPGLQRHPPARPRVGPAPGLRRRAPRKPVRRDGDRRLTRVPTERIRQHQHRHKCRQGHSRARDTDPDR